MKNISALQGTGRSLVFFTATFLKVLLYEWFHLNAFSMWTAWFRITNQTKCLLIEAFHLFFGNDEMPCIKNQSIYSCVKLKERNKDKQASGCAKRGNTEKEEVKSLLLIISVCWPKHPVWQGRGILVFIYVHFVCTHLHHVKY